jgi:hypothetical protein
LEIKMRTGLIALVLTVCSLPATVSADEGANPIECTYAKLDKTTIPLIFHATEPGNEEQARAIREGQVAVNACRQLHRWTPTQADASVQYAWGRFNYETAVARLRTLGQDLQLLDRWASSMTDEESALVLGGDIRPVGRRMSEWFLSTELAVRFTPEESRALGRVLGAGMAGLLLVRRTTAAFNAN